MASEEESDFSRSFQNAKRYALDSKFMEIQNLKPVQEAALFKYILRNDVFSVLPTGCGKSLILCRLSVCTFMIKVLNTQRILHWLLFAR